MKRGKKLIGLVVAVILGLSLILVPALSRVSPVQAAVTWTKYPGEVTLKYPVTLDNELHVVDAWIIKESSTSYKMWYTHGKKDLSISDIIDVVKALNLDALIADIADLDLAQFLNDLDDLTGDVSDIVDLFDGISTVIGYATSTNGRTWTVQNSQALVGSSSTAWDSVGAPCVIWDATDNQYKMWYTRVKTSLTQTILGDILDDIATGSQAERKAAIIDLFDSFSTVIGYATSDNGKDWTVQKSQALAGSSGVWDSVADPCVIRNGATDYEMWYTRPKTDLTRDDLDDILTNIDDFGIADLLDILDGASTIIEVVTSNDGINWGAPQEALAGGVGAWDSVADPSVVKTGGTYEMWYTNAKTNLIEANLHTLANEIKGLGISTLWDSLKTKSLADFILDLLALDIDGIKSILSGTSTVIGYATSSDGVNWTVQNSQHLVGSSGGPWSSVAAPSVVKTYDRYEMWYTEGIGDLTWPNIAGIVLGTNLPIGYAYYTPAPPPPPPSPVIETNLFGIEASFPISDEGVIEEEIVATSEDETLTITIEAGTIALDIEGEPLETLTAAVAPSPPEPPEDTYLMGAYNFGPDKATFDPPMTLTWSYDPETLPEDVDLVIAYYDEVNEEWVWVPCEVDTENNIITASVAHFTTFAIIAVPAELPPVVPVPAAFTVSSLRVSPSEITPSEEVNISVLVANTGDESGSYEVTLKIDDVVVATKEVTLAGGASQKVTFTTTKDITGTYSVDVSGLTGSFTVKEEVVPPVPAAFTISSLTISPAEVDVGKSVTISVLASNTGDLTGSYEVTLKIDNVVVETKEVTLAGGASQKVTFTTTKDIAGTYTVNVNGQSSTFTVKEKVVPPVVPKPIAWWVWLIIGLVSAAVVGFAVWMVIRRRRA